MHANPIKPITLLICDDHSVVRRGLRVLLETDARFAVVGEAGNGREAVIKAKSVRPDVILMDLAMPILNGVEATRQIHAADPAARVLALSAYSDDAYVERMHAVGASGFVQKQSSLDILRKAIQVVVGGGTFLDPVLTGRLSHSPFRSGEEDDLPPTVGSHLTCRECEVLQLVAEGSANKQVAAELGISIKTVEKHRQQLMDKLNIHNTASLTRYAVAAGIIENPVAMPTRG